MAQQQNGALTEKSIIKELKAQFTPFYNLYTVDNPFSSSRKLSSKRK